MTIFVCLLRGINLAGHNRLSMNALREMCESFGHTGVQTYIQSGNVVFRTGAKDAKAVAAELKAAIEKTAGIKTDVVLRTRQELKAVVEHNPFASRKDVPGNKLLVTFFDRKATAEAIARVNAMELPPEEFRMIGRELYVYFPNGAGRSKFPAASISKLLNASGTARNWNTVLKLLDMATAAEASAG